MKFIQLSQFFLALALGILGWPCRGNAAETLVTAIPTTNWGTWEAWGTSLCWEGRNYGQRDDFADILFTLKDCPLNGRILPGLGFNYARYNVGACSTNLVNGLGMVDSPKMKPDRKMEGFWLDPVSSDPESTSWNWEADANQRAYLQKAKARGVNKFELFSNSPMWWMLLNRNPAGNGTKDNLAPAHNRNFAIYMATVAQRAADHWGITFTTVEAFNEPLSTWWKSTGTQEGCHFSTGLQATIIDLLRQELDARGLTSMAIAASDCNRYDEAVSNWNAFNALTRAKVGQINVHGYQYSSGNRAGVYAAARAAEKPLYNSEYGESDVSGLKLAASVHRDFWTLHPTVWAHWQTMGSAWGTFTDTQTNPKHYVIAQYSRHIRPGMLILESSSESTVIAYDATAQKLVLVVANVGAAQDYRFDLGRFGSADGPVVRWLTVTGSGGERYVRHDDVAITNQQFSMSLPSGSVETFEIQNVRGPFLQVQPTLDKNTRKTE